MGSGRNFLPVLMVPMAYMFLENSVSTNRTEVKTLSKSTKRGEAGCKSLVRFVITLYPNSSKMAPSSFSLYKPQIDTETHWMRLT
ncbi:hypothetical protein CEXT_221441 [Caerostris extrusa]|uniref:Secreted protein n=1 Tax=Caerostris extrusa TaxID=172846 RepID=A0AAV4W144_CAEEX|nr:hypothetical protein CEXT_221441 [Caerostris extrusa]